MSDIISLLPDHIANQIAAGEVIQRPASAIKELLENAIDAGATNIHLMIREAGKELIQVNDNGKGMSPTDARLSFERHATSKIKSIDDLFQIRTMGFRGEALASMAAVAQVELKTRRIEDEVGTYLYIEHSQVKTQEACQTPNGTSISLKNLFFNVPARRNFLKSNTVEMRHIVDEFTRIAMAYPPIGFRLTNNQTDLFVLEPSKLKQRILALLGNQFNSKLVPVDEPTDFVTISGFVASPDVASKTRGNQYFFVNNRFVKSAYLNHAVTQAFRELIAKDEFPSFVLFIEIDPKRVDINVHPTKQEIKFEDDQIIYSFVNSAVKHALSKYSIAPSLDFSLDSSIEQLSAVTQPFASQMQTHTKGDFLFQSFVEKGKAHFLDKKEDVRNWKDLYKIQADFQQETSSKVLSDQVNQRPYLNEGELGLLEDFQQTFFQINAAYIIATTKTGFMLIDQHLAHQRILYERFEEVHAQPVPIQKCLVPLTFELAPADAILLQTILPDLIPLGYEIEPFGQHSFIIQGTPSDVKLGNEKASIEKMIDSLKHFSSEIKLDKREKLIRTLAMQKAIPHGKKLNHQEIETLMQDLFRCEQPQLSPLGKKIFAKLSQHDIEKIIQHA
jgi:DNA mismatch repair protein MutL